MDQVTINMLAAAAFAALGWFARTLWERQEAHSKELAEVRVMIAGEYVSNLKLSEAMRELKGDLRYIRDRLDETPQRRQSDHE